MRVEKTEILRTFSCGEDPLDIFDGYAELHGVRLRSCRRWLGQSHASHGVWLSSRVVFRGQELDYGEDPRIFVHQGRICISSCVWSQDHGFRNHLMEIDGDGAWKRYYLMPPTDLEAGKNWSPFSFPDGSLGFVHSFSPLKILKEVRREEGIILLGLITADGIAREEGDWNGFAAHRGGSNGVTIGAHIIGFGHTTRIARRDDGSPFISPGSGYPRDEQVVHRPFFWKMNAFDRSIHWSALEHDWDPRYWIVDPTSLIRVKDADLYELYTTEVERNYVDVHSAGRTVRYTISLS